MKTGIVIVNYNDFLNTKRLIDNIKDYKTIDKIVVVDNNSTDKSVEKLQEIKLPNFHLIIASTNKGYGAGLNLGARYLISEYKECNIIFSNADIVIKSENDIKDLLSVISKHNVIVAPTIIEGNNLNRGWKNPTPFQEIILNIPYFSRKYRHKFIEYKEEYYYKPYSKVDVVSGCFFIVSSKHLQDINFFDENVFLYYEENIIGIKTKKLNKNILVYNDINVIHDHSVTIDKSINKIKKFKLLKKSQYYFEKNYNCANIIERVLLKISAFISYIIFCIYYKIS